MPGLKPTAMGYTLTGAKMIGWTGARVIIVPDRNEDAPEHIPEFILRHLTNDCVLISGRNLFIREAVWKTMRPQIEQLPVEMPQCQNPTQILLN